MQTEKEEEKIKVNYRHEKKHTISYGDALEIRSRLSVIAKPDGHAVGGKYFIRSLYFDNSADKALREKLDGVNCREKFRIRCYNLDPSAVFLEKKSKINGLCLKESVKLSSKCAHEISAGNFDFLKSCDGDLIREFLQSMTNTGIAPKTIVDYVREPFVYAPGNVRVTIDSDIRTGIFRTDFLSPDVVTVPTGDDIVLEVKWDEFLPDIIRDAVALRNCTTTAFSKYAVCRIYG